MKFRKLQYFVVVAEELNFSKAAKRLNMSQPPLSLQIKSLEDDLGTKLFNRSSRHVELTLAGESFLSHARQALSHLERGADVVRQTAMGMAGEIKIAFTASVPMFEEFPKLLHTFREQYPSASVDLKHMSTGQQLKCLKDKTIDVGFLRPSMLFVPPQNTVTQEIWTDRLFAVLPAYHALAQGSRMIRMEELVEENFVLFPRGLGCGLFEHVSTVASRAGFAPTMAQAAREGATIVGLVASGMGISILPEAYAKIGIPGVVFRELDNKDANSCIHLAFRAGDVPPLVQNFIDLLTNCEITASVS